MNYDEILEFPRTDYNSECGKIAFYPPVYEQRYDAVYTILCSQKWKTKLKTVVDFGCGGLDFFHILKCIDHINLVLCIDVNASKLRLHGEKAEPTFADKIRPRSTSFRAKVYTGSIGKTDSCLLNTDAIVCIEVIEHLYPRDLNNLPYTIFGFAKPLLAIFTTPNVEFNVLFPEPKKLRNKDHKFEWTRIQFQDWANNITKRFPNYCVDFHDIGPPPKGYNHLGPVTQMAVFYKHSFNLPQTCSDIIENNSYCLIYDFVYPMNPDQKTGKN